MHVRSALSDLPCPFCLSVLPDSDRSRCPALWAGGRTATLDIWYNSSQLGGFGQIDGFGKVS
jgi:hypothetical protein